MGKIRTKTLGSEETEQEQARRSQARRIGKKERKAKVEGVGMKGGERSAVVEGLDEETMKKLEDLSQSSSSPQSPQSLADEQEGKKSKAKKRTPGIPKKRSKRYKDALKLVDRSKYYPVVDALELIKKTSLTRFDGTVEAHIALDATHLKPSTPTSSTKQTKEEKAATKAATASVRGTVQFPHGTGKQVRVAIADEALIAAVEGGKIEFDVLIAHPSMMAKLAKVARVLGPKGLMPNPKTGTVTDKPEEVAKKFSGGQVAFKTEPDNPLIHSAIGKVSFEADQLKENLAALTRAIGANKIVKITLSATMGPGIKVDPATV